MNHLNAEDRQKRTLELCTAIDALIAFVNRYGTYEEIEGFLSRGWEGSGLDHRQLEELISLVARVEALCTKLQVSPPPSVPLSDSGYDWGNILFTYQPLILNAYHEQHLQHTPVMLGCHSRQVRYLQQIECINTEYGDGREELVRTESNGRRAGEI